MSASDTGKLPARCGCAFAAKNKFLSCEIVNETMHLKSEAATRKKDKKNATIKRRKDKKTAAAKTKRLGVELKTVKRKKYKKASL
jgi:hypothetical protein